jgi:hypothetical protein
LGGEGIREDGAYHGPEAVGCWKAGRAGETGRGEEKAEFKPEVAGSRIR